MCAKIPVDPPIQFPIDPYSTPIDPYSTPADPYSTPFDAFSTKALQIPIGKQLGRLPISTAVERAIGRGKQGLLGRMGHWGDRAKGAGRGKGRWLAAQEGE